MDPKDVPSTTTEPGRVPVGRPAFAIEAGDVLADRFVVGANLGYGATGTVFAALDRSVGQKVAIKVFYPELHDERTRERLRREVRAARAGHPDLVTVYDLHETESQVFLSMELVEGQSLRKILDRRRRLETIEVESIGRQIADVLASRLDPDLLPQILAREVLDRTNK